MTGKQLVMQRAFPSGSKFVDNAPAAFYRPLMSEVLARLFDVSELVVLVTGGASGLGLAITGVLAECGATVVMADQDTDALGEAAAQLAETVGGLRPGAVEPAAVDVSDADAITGLAGEIVARHGRIDVAFANAGIARGRGPGQTSGSLEEFDLADWQRVLDVNLLGVVHTMRAVAVPMKRQRSGSIVVTASTAGLRQDPYVSYSYIVAKAGVVNLVRQAALDLARWQVRVNAIAPGPFRTRLGGKGPRRPESEAQWNAAVPLGRMGDPAEIRGLAMLLASGASSFMTGGVYPVDGGHLLQSPALGLPPEVATAEYLPPVAVPPMPVPPMPVPPMPVPPMPVPPKSVPAEVVSHEVVEPNS
jgi:NAD(P)-dependent dehydrogenase (short-subunit alcohol dehydrogenase family)